MAWMKSTNTGKWYRTYDHHTHVITDQAEARQVSDSLGFNAEVVAPAVIQAEMRRVAANRADLVSAVAAAVPGGVTAVPSAQDIARAVEVQLADEFAAVNTNINRPRTVS